MRRLLSVTLVAAFLIMPFRVHAAATNLSLEQVMSKLEWRSIGPTIGGRVVAVAGVPSEPNVFYMGGVEGGVWKSDDYGRSWENITDGKIPGIADSIGAIAVAPSNPNIIYVGTGEGDIRGDFDTGDGVYKTTDGGKTWQYAGLRETHTTTSIVIDPHDPNIVYLTSLGHVFKPNPQRGVYKTTDGGKTWNRILYVNAYTGGNVVVMDSHNPNVLYASMWQEQRTPWTLASGGPGSGLYKSADAGAHWTKISTHPGFAHGMLGKMGIAVAPSDPRMVYAIVQAADGGVFRSGNGGATWTRVNDQWMLRQRAFYYMAIYVDPKNANVLYAPEVDSVWKSTDAGKTWAPLTGGCDCHITWVNPRNTQILIVGNDGGATVSVNGGKTWSSENNQPTGQFYHITIDDRFPYHVYGAQQDEGAFEGPSASHEGLTLGRWHPVALGESTFIAVDPRDPHITYGSGYFTSLARLNGRTGDEKNVSPWPLYLTGVSAAQQKYRFGWTHPILFSPANPNELFETAQVVFKSDDFGQTWTVISPDLTRNVKSTEGTSGGTIYPDQAGTEIYPDISSLAISPLDGNVIWAGSSDGLVHVTTDGGAHWKLVTPPQLREWTWITSIESSRAAAGTAYLTASRYKWDDFHPYIYKTTDYGAHWTALTTGIEPDQYVYVVREDPRDPRVLFAGTRSTVYVSLNGGNQWFRLTLNLPGVQVRDIAISARQGEVAAATHGRGFWILDNLALLEQLASDPSQMLFAPETAWLSHAYGGGGRRSAGENPKYGATVYFDIPKGYDGKTPATLSFLDPTGKPVRSFTLHLRNPKAKKLKEYQLLNLPTAAQQVYELERETAIAPGMNAFQWDMRYPPATDVRGLHMVWTDDYADTTDGPTILPGTYTAVLDYGGTVSRKTFLVRLDPRINPVPGALEARLALAMQIRNTLDSLDGTINAALSARSRMSAANRSKLDTILSGLVDFRFSSSEADVMWPTELRDHLAFLLNELDLAYEAPTSAEQATYTMLDQKAESAITQLRGLLSTP
jgi:photosystem II stability/assembly factor-like uncharacterized protein